MAKLEAVLWDFGGVFSPSPFSALAALGREKGLEEGHYFEAIFGPYDGDTDHPWHRLERGEIDFVSAREAIMQGARARGFEADPIELFARMGQGGGMRQDVIAVATRIKSSGYRSAIVTNNAKEFRERWVASVPVAEICDEIVDSSEVGVRKPDPRIFEIALERLGGIAPERALFVDDSRGTSPRRRPPACVRSWMEDDYAGALEEIERLTR
ncbi:MAG: HAD hydrolase-like protein [Myxococcota bacterium]